MFSLRNGFGILSMISALALLLAMTGNAWAASDVDGSASSSAKQNQKRKQKKKQSGLTGKQKKEVEAIAKKFQGTGPQGPVGPAGPIGPVGPPGPKGDPGSSGGKGPTGAKGTTGKKGPTGAVGTKGPTGTKGSTGTAGSPGSKGPTGAVGTKGPTGTKGATGAGATGAKGPTGDVGAEGPTGAAGSPGTKGPTGAVGPTGAPGGATGAIGPPGAKGPTGAGATGATGPTGTTGAKGAAGAKGATGVSATGAEGATGEKGATGATGTGGGGVEPPLTGVWSVHSEEGGAAGEIPLHVPISYIQEVSPAPDLVYVGPGPGSIFGIGLVRGIVIDTETGELTGPETLESQSSIEAVCGPGSSAANPDAEPGHLCVFATVHNEIHLDGLEPFFEEPPDPSPLWISPSPENGAVIPFTLAEEGLFAASLGGFANGSWALNP